MDNGIELVISSEMLETKEAFAQLTSQLNQTTKALEKIEKTTSNFGKSVSKNMKEATDETKKLGDNASKALKKMNNADTFFNGFRNVAGSIKDVTKNFMTLVNSAVDYSEELNLFNVVFKNNISEIDSEFSEVGLKAEQFQQTLHEAFGTNLLETRRFQALFQAMGENMGIINDKAEIMSKNMTKLTYDIASLYNASEEDVGNALKAGVYAGQTKPLRRFGIDVTQVSMQPIMDELGLEKSISELSQAEKQILRYLSVIRQASVAHGDFANTIESPANQLKIFKQQLEECKIALGNLFIGAYARILPYANAILMVIKEVAKAIASFFGIKVEDYNTGISTTIGDYEELGDTIDGIGDSAGGATKAVKELKRQTLGFDQINNITSPTPSSGSSGGGVSGSGGTIGGIDQKLLDALKGYENGMEKIRMKANEIRDKIMEWLGFTKVIDPLTGEVSWKFESIGKTIKSLWEHFKGLSATGKIIMGLGIIAGATTLLALGGKLIKVFGSTGLGKAITALIGPTTTLIKLIAGKGISEGITEWQKYAGILDKNGQAVTGFAGALAKAKTVFTGTLVYAGGMAVYYDSFRNIREEGANLVNVLGAVGGGLATVGGAMTVGATVAGPYGAIIGGIVGALSVLTETMILATDAYPEHTKKIRELKKANDDLESSYKNNIKAIEEGVKTHDIQIESDKKLVEELKSITDENGRVKAGYEDRANFILGRLKDAYGIEAEMVDGVIKNYQQVVKSINDVIGAKKAQIYFNAYEKEYEESVIASANAEEQVRKAVKERNTALQDLTEEQEKANQLTARNQEITDYLKEKGLNPLSKEYKTLTDELKKNVTQLEISSNKQVQLKESLEGYNTEVERATKVYIEATNTQQTYSDMWVAQQAGNWAEVERLYKEGSKKTTNDFKNSLIEQAKAVDSGGELTTNIIEGFRILAVNSEKKYREALSKLSPDTQNAIEDALKETNKKKKSAYGTFFNFGEEAKKGVNTATEGLADDTVKQFTGKFTGKKSLDSFRQSGTTAGNTLMNNIKKETDKGVTVPVKTNTSGVTDSVKNAVTNYGRGYVCRVDFVTNGSQTFSIKKNALGGIFSNGIWKNIKQYANGGLPNHGTMFTAGERGPEIVGHIGRRTEVLNQSQLASVMYEAVSKAISNNDFGGIEFYAHTDEGVIIDRINRRTRQTGQCPLEI